MSAAIIAQLVIALGPAAFSLIESLVSIWSKASLTVDEVLAITSVARTTYDQYIASKSTPALPEVDPTVTIPD